MAIYENLGFPVSKSGVLQSQSPQFGGTKKEPKPKLLSPDIFWWGGGLPREGVGAKKFGMSLETREIPNFFGVSRDFAGISRKRPKSLRKKSLCSILGLNLGKDYLSKPWTAGSFRKCPRKSSRKIPSKIPQIYATKIFLQAGHAKPNLEDPNLLKLRSPGSSCPFPHLPFLGVWVFFMVFLLGNSLVL